MAVRFLIGRAGTGKTHHCLGKITAACETDPLGPPLIYLVPEQGSYQAEKSLLTFGKLRGLTRAQVLSFTRLADFIFARGAAPRLPRLTKAHRRVLVMLLVSQARREDPDGLAAAQGIEDALLDFIAETRQQAVDPESIRVVIESLLSGRSTATPLTARLLADKLARLCRLLENYQAFTRDRFQDPEDTLAQLAHQVLGSPLLQGAEVFVDGFTGFTPVEEKILVALARRASRMSITLHGDPGRCRAILGKGKVRRHGVLQAVEETLTDLLALFQANQVDLDGPVYFGEDSDPPRFHDPGLVAVERHFFSLRPDKQIQTDAVAFYESRTTREEAREAAELAAAWMREHGWGAGEIGILARDLEDYAAPLSQALETLRIPHFIDRAQPLGVHPFVTGILALCRGALVPGRDFARHVTDFAKSGLPSVPRREIDRLEYEITQHPRKPSEWFSSEPWLPPPSRSPMDEDDERSREAESFAGEIDKTRRVLMTEVIALRNAIKGNDGRKGPLDSFFKALAHSLVRMAGARPITDLDKRILERVLDTLAIAVETAGSEVVAWDAALELLQRLLGDLTLPRIPPMAGELFVGQVDRSRQPPLRGVILLGLAEGIFPRVIVNHSLVNDGERDLLEKTGLRLRPSGRRQFEREALHAWRAVTSASHRLALFRPRENAQGEALAESAFWEDLRGVLPAVPVNTFPRRDDPDRAWRYRELAAAALRGASGTHLDPNADPKPAAGLVGRILGVGEGARVYQEATWKNRATLPGELVSKFHGGSLHLSASQLESFARCPYQHFLRYQLRPTEVLLPRFERRDAGNYFHAVLRNFTALLRERGLAGTAMERDAILALLGEAREEPARRLSNTGLLDGATGVYLFQRLNQMIEDMAVWVVEGLAILPLRPTAEEISFGSRGELPPLKLDLGGDAPDIFLRGQIDRLDLLEDGDAVVVDYKLHRKTFDFNRWECGESIQLPIYLLAIEGATLEGKALKPRGALYAPIVAKTLEEETYSTRAFEGLVDYGFLEGLIPGDKTWKMAPLARSSNDPRKGPTRYGPHLIPDEFQGVLEGTRRLLGALAGDILAGVIDVEPSRHGTVTACSLCNAREVCGIDYRLNKARHRPDRGRHAILADLRGGEEAGS